MKDVVIQRRMDVTRRTFSNELQRSFRDPRAVAFIVPERLRVDTIETQRSGEDKDEKKNDR